MNKNIKTNRLTEAALISGILIVFAMVGTYLFPFIDFLYPLPVLLLAKRHDFKASIMALASAGLIIFMVLGIQMGLYYVLLYSPMAGVMAYFISQDKKPAMAILWGGATYLVSFILLLMLMQVFLSINLVTYIRETFVESLRIQESILSNFGDMSDQLEATRETYDSMIEMVIVLLPAMIIFTSVAMSTINYMVVQRMGKRLRVNILPLQDFSQFRLPANISIGILVFVIGSYLAGALGIVNSQALLTNVVFIIQILFFLQGLAVVKFMMIKYKINRLLRVLMFLVVIFNAMLNMGVMFLGFGDLLFDLRKIKNKNRW